MARKSLKTLNKMYETENFFNVIIESYINGHLAQCKEQYNMMKPQDQKTFLMDLVWNDYVRAIEIMRVIL
ncbi:MAG: hypothetical protein IAC58_02895 [Firmicutes bacterium]|uniref:Uncharacterized protein n=1 Tax=Candidatus Onthovivens merdipullorum TaxID=2840889 RepID=A0A9D9DGX8_9BACL|nr:hypothetical protein [Candidatus Onthovivens merdipullorum]